MRLTSRRSRTLLAPLAVFVVAASAGAQSFSGQVVLATANLYGAGNAPTTTPAPGGGLGGTIAPVFALTPGTLRTLLFHGVTSTVQMSPGQSVTPDGVLVAGGGAPYGLSTSIASYGGISGIQLDAGSGFLVGVFLDRSKPVGAPPAPLAFTNLGTPGMIATSFASLMPSIGQAFFIGDGLSGSGGGAIQTFVVPNAATHLVLGFADGSGYAGLPGQYQDNSGSVVASFDVRGVVATPEPATFALVVAPLVALGAGLRRRAPRPSARRW